MDFFHLQYGSWEKPFFSPSSFFFPPFTCPYVPIVCLIIMMTLVFHCIGQILIIYTFLLFFSFSFSFFNEANGYYLFIHQRNNYSPSIPPPSKRFSGEVVMPAYSIDLHRCTGAPLANSPLSECPVPPSLSLPPFAHLHDG